MRNYKRKTTHGSTSEEVYELAAKEVLENKEKKSSKQPKDRVKKKVLQESSEDDNDEDETICLGCGSSYSEDICGVDWVECICCKGWSHITCIKGDAVAYVCLYKLQLRF
uniref:Zinc finger PHD-type domain-containing protein n=1 Tax=Heliothis virescens TaxID=7102 RepID=A0A2A4JAQ5_HELVI